MIVKQDIQDIKIYKINKINKKIQVKIRVYKINQRYKINKIYKISKMYNIIIQINKRYEM